MRWPSTSTHSATPSFIVIASGCAPPMPPRPAVSVIVPPQRSAEPPARDLGEALVGPLEDALRADVDPRARGHLPVHREAERLEPSELLPRRPVRDQVGVRDEHPWRPFVRAEDPDRLARLHEHRLVGLERAQRGDERVERGPRACGAPGAAVDDEIVGPLRDIGVEVVHQHAHGGLLRPALAGERGPPRCAHRPRPGGHPSGPVTDSTADTSTPEATTSTAASSSGVSQRSGPGPGTTTRSAASAAPVGGAGLERARAARCRAPRPPARWRAPG